MVVIVIALISGMFISENAEFFNKTGQQVANGAKWEYVGLQERNPNLLAIPLVNQDTGKESIIFKLSGPQP